jgi:hypothetical protein
MSHLGHSRLSSVRQCARREPHHCVLAVAAAAHDTTLAGLVGSILLKVQYYMSFVGITAMPQPDGTIKAVEVHVFAEPLRGIGEGHYPWDLMPNSSMTNAAVTQQVKKAEGNTLMLKYKDGEKTIVVPSDATVVNLIPGDRGDLKRVPKSSSRGGRKRRTARGEQLWRSSAVMA